MRNKEYHIQTLTDPDLQKLSSLLSEYSFTQFVDEPTHRRGHTLDWRVVAQDSTLIKDVSLPENLLSGYESVFFSLSLRRPPRKKHLVTSRNIRLIDPDKCRSELKDIFSMVLADCPEEDVVQKITSVKPDGNCVALREPPTAKPFIERSL